jgi:hypothetical protein
VKAIKIKIVIQLYPLEDAYFFIHPDYGDTPGTSCHLYCGYFSLRIFTHANQISAGPFLRDELIFLPVLTVRADSDGDEGLLRSGTSPAQASSTRKSD